jgi:hypothetical protein
MSSKRIITDKELLRAFQEQFQTGRLLSESNVLVLMAMARGEAKKDIASRFFLLPRAEALLDCSSDCTPGGPNCKGSCFSEVAGELNLKSK